MIRKILSVIVMGMLLAVNVAQARDDFQYWHQMSLKPYHKGKVDFILFTENRFVTDARKLGLYYISPRLVYHANKNLDLGLNYTYLQSRKTTSSAIDDSYNRQHRVEFEINPQWQVADWLKLKIRNRLELRWIEMQEGDLSRYRQRVTWEVPLKHTGILKSIYTSNEIFYELRKHNFMEDQVVPLGLSFKFNDKVGLNVYYMILSQRGTRDWSSNQIIGTLLSIIF